ncbi:hypothetical protein K443DRAFT_681628 [Laccaria amethystina LaAM-08-1]|uniref:Uncharacterized protein n=1 Tax=Laccaria amethystina LaAM-08-1 TaxID=1095629 RepID=A0A0C9X7F1_9AGAR|nr:hypothetical protein K443DRAFT_681628 [Laccaria amethystina LaAM-08-1]
MSPQRALRAPVYTRFLPSLRLSTHKYHQLETKPDCKLSSNNKMLSGISRWGCRSGTKDVGSVQPAWIGENPV